MLISLIRMSISRINGSCIPANRRNDRIGGSDNIIRQRCRESLPEIQPRPSPRRDDQAIQVLGLRRAGGTHMHGTARRHVGRHCRHCRHRRHREAARVLLAGEQHLGHGALDRAFRLRERCGAFRLGERCRPVGRESRRVAGEVLFIAEVRSGPVLRRSAAGQGGTRARTVRYSAAGRRRYSSRSPSPDSSSPGSASGWRSPGRPRRR